MKYRVTFEDGRPHEVEVKEGPDGTIVILDGVEHTVDFSLPGDEDGVASVDDRPYAMRVTREGESFALDLPGGRRVAAIEEEAVWVLRQAASQKRSATGAKKGEELKSPISGVVLSIPVADGAAIAAGDTVIVIEAMKMENPIQAIKDCKLSRILVKVGETVKAGQVLMVFE
jgi:acetyl-CoA/propionyl-CoA carboxylase, biotin carboxylase, biotin carboxyl carrier protein